MDLHVPAPGWGWDTPGAAAGDGLEPLGGFKEHFLWAGLASRSQLLDSGLAQGVSNSCSKLAFLSLKLKVKCSWVL